MRILFVSPSVIEDARPLSTLSQSEMETDETSVVSQIPTLPKTLNGPDVVPSTTTSVSSQAGMNPSTNKSC